MKKALGILLIPVSMLSACMLFQPAPKYLGVPAYLDTPAQELTITPPVKTFKIHVPPVKATWQIQYTGTMDYTLPVEVYDLDLFDTEAAVIAQLHDRGVFVMCYFSAGSYEDWRPDAEAFPAVTLGQGLAGWPGEKWLDIRKLDLLAPVITARLDLAVQKGCDGVDPDNVDGYKNETGFPLTYNDQHHYNIWLANSAHTRGLSIGLKNDLEQIPDLLPYFDWAVNEECFQFNECASLLPFVQAGKPVFNIEYNLQPSDFCPQAKKMGFSSILKNRALDAPRTPCT